MKKYLNRIYTILLIILCVVLCVLQIQAGTLLSTGTIIRFVIIFIAYGLGMAYNKKSLFVSLQNRRTPEDKWCASPSNLSQNKF